LKIEINTREHFTVLALRKQNVAVHSPWFRGDAEVPIYAVDELLGTKLRALYQRKKGRDLFDLWLAFDQGLLDAATVVDCFQRYMAAGGAAVSRAEFEANLAKKAGDRAFHEDVRPLLAMGVSYDPLIALEVVERELLARLPGEPWKGGDVIEGLG
jgi:predicted nucleotidyltransferase component of viral defense system